MSKMLSLYALGFFTLLGCSTTGSHRAMDATLWVQTSGEFKALSYQAYNLATMRLKKALKNKKGKPWAVIMDVDETLLDNSSYQARNILTGRGYPDGWFHWVEGAQSQAFPGSAEFAQWASGQGVALFYLTNRKYPTRKATITNLKKMGFPVVDDHVMTRPPSGKKSKGIQREGILKKYRIAMLIGDNLADFNSLFEKAKASKRVERVEEMKERFGTDFIILPNPMYGDWESSLYDYHIRELSPEQMKDIRRKSLISSP